MAGPRLTLKNRIITLLIISTILFIGAFCAIQLNNQISNLISHNTYKAKLSSLIVKHNLQELLKKAPLKEEAVKFLQSGLSSLARARIIDEASIIDREGKVVASTTRWLIGEVAAPADLKMKDVFFKGPFEAEKEFAPRIDRKSRLLHIFMPIKSPMGETRFCVKATFSLGNIQEALLAVYRPAIFIAVVVISANALLGILLSKTVVGPIKVLNKVTKIIAGGNLNVRADIRTKDELEELGETFNYMTAELIKMKERAENVNPLTKLPGNIVIREEVARRAKANEKFIVIHTDLDKFKAYNDKYGLSKGDEAIKLTSQILKEATGQKGNPDDLLGHGGGDDFVLVTTPDKLEELTSHIIAQFDSKIRSLYAQEDLRQGYIIAHSRAGETLRFPIMSISLAGVGNLHREISSYAQVTNISAEVMRKAKSIEGSVFIMDKRRT